MKPIATLPHLQRRRADILKKRDHARKAHRGQRLAQRDAAKATHALLRAEISARKAATRKATKPAPAGADLFSMEFV